MVNPKIERGHLFEKWVHKVIKPYVHKTTLTKYHEHYDIKATEDYQHYLLECKCINYFEGKNRHISKLYIPGAQLVHLQNRKNSIHGENHIIYVVGVLFSEMGELYPVAISLERIMSMGRVDKHKRRYIKMNEIIREEPLWMWMKDTLKKTEGQSIKYPKFNLEAKK